MAGVRERRPQGGPGGSAEGGKSARGPRLAPPQHCTKAAGREGGAQGGRFSVRVPCPAAANVDANAVATKAPHCLMLGILAWRERFTFFRREESNVLLPAKLRKRKGGRVAQVNQDDTKCDDLKRASCICQRKNILFERKPAYKSVQIERTTQRGLIQTASGVFGGQTLL
ncbi:uncharacterized protein M8220_003144 [Acridotheres tristis]